MVQKVQKTVNVPQVQYNDKVVDIPVVKQVSVPQVAAVACGGTGGVQVAALKWKHLSFRRALFPCFIVIFVHFEAIPCCVFVSLVL